MTKVCHEHGDNVVVVWEYNEYPQHLTKCPMCIEEKNLKNSGKRFNSTGKFCNISTGQCKVIQVAHSSGGRGKDFSAAGGNGGSAGGCNDSFRPC